MGPFNVEVVTTVGTGLLVGALLVVGGALIGIWLARRTKIGRRDDDVHARELRELLQLIGSLSNWTQGLAGEMSQYESKLRGALSDDAASGGDAGPSDGRWLRDILSSNEHLRLRLQDAERLLADKAREVEAYLSEARTDMLTSLPNRRAFDDELGRRFAQWQRYGTPLSVMILDIDHFKKFNDTWGHLAGDFVLQQVARTLTATVRDSDLLVRLGGEELAVVMPSTSIDDGAKAAMRFGQAVRSARFDFEGQRLQVSVSIGVAQAIEEDSVTSLIQRADEAMYAAKQNGRDRSWFHDGRACRPAGDEPARLDLASRGGVPKQLESVCDGLRERLIQVTRR